MATVVREWKHFQENINQQLKITSNNIVKHKKVENLNETYL